jgi:iron complex transport system permease protein
MTSVLKTNGWRIAGILLGIILLFLCFLSSVIFGFTDITWSILIQSFTTFDGSNEHLIIQTTRIPRAVIAVIVGASLAIAGALMQALTRNPLASPGIFGVNAGASLFIVFGVSFLSLTSMSEFVWMAFAGAAVAAVAVYFLGSVGREGLTPMKLTLAGAATAALFSSLTQGMLVVNEKALDEVLFWLAGSVVGRKLDMLIPVLPYVIIAWLASFFIAKHINILTMGEDVAKGLGQRTVWVKGIAALIIVILAGGSVAVAGPIAFVGIVVPHIARVLVGNDYRWIIPYCTILGGIFLLLADIGARFIIMPKEVPVGVMTAMIGTPFFIFIARRGFK